VSIEDLVRAVVSDAIQTELAPYLRKLTLPEPKTYSTKQAGIVLGVHPDTIAAMVEDGRSHGCRRCPARSSSPAGPWTEWQMGRTLVSHDGQPACCPCSGSRRVAGETIRGPCRCPYRPLRRAVGQREERA
jgi:hypothetical protein